MTFEIHRIAANGDSVLTERTDTFTINGAHRTDRGHGHLRPARWADRRVARDFDMGLTGRLMSGEDVDASLLPMIA